VLEERSLHPRARKSQEGASSVEARIILLLNAHTIATMMMMMIRRAKEGQEGQDDLQEEEGWFICGHLG
jgi:hypothetical protein